MRVLLVDDETEVRRFFARVLTDLGSWLEVLQAADGREALELFQREPVDLVLSDQRMPHMTGLELLMALRSHSHVPFLLISADDSIARVAFALGANEFLTKPISLVALRNVVKHYAPPAEQG